ncbi:putative NADPH-quinone reductase (modulator of drug activity B) [Lacticaseibacillus brantae DSM 23927]|uniref:Putative NADPH-quinone reductase (Modulator of drug activity B) n=2 Tax=Lacticaseibacillus brantae TaxID=943673 RepID=A0A0R2B1R2_9LACO|nr:putative NADPH-quinone reductase (modulator of drug activity B) [Lacticaseibacillus brantae DSM 23927]
MLDEKVKEPIMKTLVVVSHPKIETSNTQQFLKESLVGLDEVSWYHLDAQKDFDSTVERERIMSANRIVFQFPLYWYSAPASLKRWLDEVWTKQVVYDENGGLLRGKTLGLVVSFSQPERDYQLGGREQFSLSELLTPYRALAAKTGLSLLAPLTISQFAYMSEAAQQALLVRYQQYLTLDHPSRFNERAQWFINQLRTYRDDTTGDLVADQLQDQQDNLERFQQTLAELKRGEAE